MGVDLMLDYGISNREIVTRKYSDADLMMETFRSSDPIDARRRITYDRVVQVFRKYYDSLSGKAPQSRAPRPRRSRASPTKSSDRLKKVRRSCLAATRCT